jgi:hypothetical protein
VQTGTSVTVTVVTYALDGTPTPVEGATVAGGGTAAVTRPDGTAVLTFEQPGDHVVKASKPGRVVSAGERVAVSVAPPPVAAPAPVVEVPDDETAPLASFSRLRNGKVYSRRRAPRRLAGTVTPDPSGLLSVRLSILRAVSGGCWAFDGESERFKRHRCGGHRSFRIGNSAEWSYLLPQRLGRGRYTIGAVAIDKAGNESTTQVVIRVR